MKRVLYVCVSLVYFSARRLYARLCALVHAERPGEGIVLCYHAIPPGESSRFAKQMDMLLQAGSPVAAHRADTVPAAQRWIAVTFDDAYHSILTGALPALQNRQIPCTVFAISGRLGEVASWAGTAGYSQEDRFMTDAQTMRLPCDLIYVGSHTCSHPFLPHLSEEDARGELQGSRRSLQNLIQKPVHFFAFPYGAHTPDLLTACLSAGYTRVFTVEPRAAFQIPDEVVCGRVVADPHDWELEFWLKVRGGYFWRASLLRLREILSGGRRGAARFTTEPAVRKSLQQRRVSGSA